MEQNFNTNSMAKKEIKPWFDWSDFIPEIRKSIFRTRIDELMSLLMLLRKE